MNNTTNTNSSETDPQRKWVKPAMSDIIWEEKSSNKPGLKGPDVIKNFVRHLPLSPGVYRMLDDAGEVLYVGKAKSLKKRVTSYTKDGGHTNRIAQMISQTATMEFVTTHTETEALLLEANLIKRLGPRYNVLMRDDKSFPYIFLSDDHQSPGIFKHRGARSRKGAYFGPFASGGAVDRTLNTLQKAFLIRTCSDSVFESRTRPCLLFQIKRCAGPCTHEIAPDDYAELIKNTKSFLSGKSRTVKAQLSAAMQAASDNMDFERAAIYRDRLSALAHIQSRQGINPGTIKEADAFAIHQDGGQSCIQVFFFRTGQNWGNASYFPKADKSFTSSQVLGAFIAQFYDDKPAPRSILLSHTIEDMDLLAQALATKSNHNVNLFVPQRGEKYEIINHVKDNAKQALGRRLAETSSQTKMLEGLKEAFDLSETPKRIEVYDNSHISGTNAVGGMIVAGPEGFIKNQYRKFNIKSEDLVPGDDYGMMREVMTRRFSRLIKEVGPRAEQPRDEDGIGPWPDLILIDGGLGQLSAVRETLQELDIEDDVPMVGIAKGPDRDAGREKFFIPGKDAFMLPYRDPVLYFVQRLRDEAHRFAIGSHRARRTKEIVRNPLDDIQGIGPGRKKALLHAYGSAKAVARAGIDDLQQVDGISEQIARKIYNHFHENG